VFLGLHEPLAAIVFPAIGLVLSVGLALGKPLRSLIDVAMGASALSAIAYLVFYIFFRGIGPLSIFGLGGAFLLYLPLTFVAALAGRIALRGRLRVVRGAPGVDEPSPRKG
jgi:hypothetical protein